MSFKGTHPKHLRVAIAASLALSAVYIAANIIGTRKPKKCTEMKEKKK